jgi:hypothetical protein
VAHQKPTRSPSIGPRASGLRQVACSLRAVGIGIGFERSAWGLHLPELEISACGFVFGNPIIAELTALEFGLRSTFERQKTEVIIESASPRLLEFLRGSFHGEPEIAIDVRNLLTAFERTHLHLVGFDDLEDARSCCQNVVQSLAIFHL